MELWLLTLMAQQTEAIKFASMTEEEKAKHLEKRKKQKWLRVLGLIILSILLILSLGSAAIYFIQMLT